MAKKNTGKAKNTKPAAAVQSDADADDTLSELEGMVSPRSEPKSGFDKVNERAQELRDGDHKVPTVISPSGATTHAGNVGRTDVVVPDTEGHKKVDAEAMKKKGKAEEGGVDPSYNPSGKFLPPRVKNTGVALPNAAKSRDKMRGS